jgi:hypothetical protein
MRNGDSKEVIPLKRKILFILIIVLIFFSGLEFLSYILISKFSQVGTFNAIKLESLFSPLLGWEPVPNTKSRTDRGLMDKPYYISVDEHGRSMTPLAFENPDIKIAITGGSTMYGVGARNQAETVPSLIESIIFEKLGVKAEVYNLAVRGYQSFQELVRYRQFLLHNSADIVISVSGFNDAYIGLKNPDIRYSLLPKSVYERGVDIVQRAEKGEPIILNINGYFRSISHFLDLLYRVSIRATRLVGRVDLLGHKVPNNPDYSLIPARVKISAMHYRMMKNLAELNGAKFIYMTQPTAYDWRDFKFDLPDLPPEKHRIHKKFTNNYYYALLSSLHDVDARDIGNVMDGKSDMPFIDRGHINGAAAEFVANRIFDEIRGNILKRIGHNSPVSHQKN